MCYYYQHEHRKFPAQCSLTIKYQKREKADFSSGNPNDCHALREQRSNQTTPRGF